MSATFPKQLWVQRHEGGGDQPAWFEGNEDADNFDIELGDSIEVGVYELVGRRTISAVTTIGPPPKEKTR